MRKWFYVMPETAVITMLTVSCANGTDPELTHEKQINISENAKTDASSFYHLNKDSVKKQPALSFEEEMAAWEREQDSLRNLILAKRKNTLVKQSVFQELYIRNLVTVKGNTLFCSIPFDNHQPDCGAPDCYTTDIKFNFNITDTIYPDTLHFTFHEEGCAVKTTYFSGELILKELTDSALVYYSDALKNALVIYKSNPYFINYLTNIAPNAVKLTSIAKILRNFHENKPASIHQYESTILTKEDYSSFLE